MTLFAAMAISVQLSAAGTLCVNPAGSHNCFSSIQTAVNHASANDVINVEAGTYKEEVDIGIPLAIIGAGNHAAIIDATGLPHGIFVDGFDHPGLKQVIITGLTVENGYHDPKQQHHQQRCVTGPEFHRGAYRLPWPTR